MRDLDDPANPYRGQYAEWDYWAFANAYEPTLEESRAWSRAQVPSTRRFMLMRVDSQGYPVPLQQQWEAPYAPPPATSDKAEACVRVYSVYADVPARIDNLMLQAELSVKARHVSPMPKWLAQEPPLFVICLPDGRFVTSGALGEGWGYEWHKERARRQIANAACYLYSAVGELLGQSRPDQLWVVLLWPEAEQVLAQYDPVKTYAWTDNGFLVVSDASNLSNFIAVYRVDGTPMPVDTDIDTHDPLEWNTFYGRELPVLYAAQQALARANKH